MKASSIGLRSAAGTASATGQSASQVTYRDTRLTAFPISDEPQGPSVYFGLFLNGNQITDMLDHDMPENGLEEQVFRLLTAKTPELVKIRVIVSDEYPNKPDIGFCQRVLDDIKKGIARVDDARKRNVVVDVILRHTQ